MATLKRNISVLNDSSGRTFKYLRLSVTDVCNFRCVYCLPNGYQKSPSTHEALDIHEVKNLVAAFGQLGFTKVRLTGGEPTVRRDIVEIAEAVSATAGISKVALSTNGYRLTELAQPLRQAGVCAINVSIDSLDETRFAQITGKSTLKEILRGVDAALGFGYQSIKINAVLFKDTVEKDLDAFIAWTKHTPISVRFIELMQTGSNLKLFQEHHVSASLVQQKLLQNGWHAVRRESDAGPALEFTHSDHLGRVGIIAPYSRDFCTTCNRLRVTSVGGLRLCLFGDKDYSLRPLLQSANQLPELINCIQNVIGHKQPSHLLSDGNYGNTQHFASIGG